MGIYNIIVNEVYTVLVFIRIESTRKETSQVNITKGNAVVGEFVSFISKGCRHLQHNV